MIISEIHIDGFGIFNGFSKSLKKGINIFLGENEAGKSTLLKFFRFTLFGYPRFKDQRMPPLSGGSHGGRIKALLSTGTEVVFERRGDDKITLYYGGNTSVNEPLWLQFLGNSTKEIYENVFAFSLDDLFDINRLSVSGVEDKIFSIGSGLGNISIGDIVNDIQGFSDQIYSQRGSKQVIPAIWKSIQEKKSSIKAIQDTLPLYSELSEDLKKLADDISRIEARVNNDRKLKSRLEDYLKCDNSFVSVIKADEELEGLPEPEKYPAGGPEKLNELEKEEKNLKERIGELQYGNSSDIGIEEIVEELKSVSFNGKILEEKAGINYLRNNLEKYKQTITDRTEDKSKRDNLDNIIDEALRAISSEWTRQTVVDFDNIVAHHDRVKTFVNELDGIKKEMISLKARKEVMLANAGRLNPSNIFILISLVFLLGSVPAFYYSLYIVAIVCVAIAIMVFFGRRYLIKENPVLLIDKELSETSYREKELIGTFTDYIGNELKLERTLSADSVLEILSTVTRLKKDISERNDLERKQRDMRDPFITDFENRVKSISDLLSDKKSDSGIEPLLFRIIDEVDFAEHQSQKKKELEDLLSKKKKELETNQAKLANNSQSITSLLMSVNATGRNDFRKKYEDNERILGLKEIRRNAVSTIEAITGINSAPDVMDFLRKHDQSGLRDEITDLELKIASGTEELKSINTLLGEKKNRLEQIEGESELAGKMTELETARQNLATAYIDWMSGRIALKIISDVREKYEKEKQPVIIRNSGRYFQKITGGRYETIHVALDKREITVFDSRAASKTIDQLSRGTREQLLLCLRLGFIEEYETNAEPLPVIVDDILVNFDPGRAGKAAAIFSEFAENRQVIIFTCHPSTVDHFKKSQVNLVEVTK